MRAWAACLFGALLCLAPPPALAGDPPPRPLVLAAHPYFAPAEIETRFALLAAFVGPALCEALIARIRGSDGQHIAAAGLDEVAVAFAGPTHRARPIYPYGRDPPV